MIGQISFFDWIACEEKMPECSGLYKVRDRRGREFETWYETTIHGFNHVFDGAGYTITEWRYL